MSLLAKQVAILARATSSHKGGAEVMRQHGDARRAVILRCVADHGPIGETEVAKRTGLLRTCCHNHLHDLSELRQIKRVDDQPRAKWIAANPAKARLVTFETEEDTE